MSVFFVYFESPTLTNILSIEILRLVKISSTIGFTSLTASSTVAANIASLGFKSSYFFEE